MTCPRGYPTFGAAMAASRRLLKREGRDSRVRACRHCRQFHLRERAVRAWEVIEVRPKPPYRNRSRRAA